MNNTGTKYMILDDVELTRNFLTNVTSRMRPDYTLVGIAEEVAQFAGLLDSFPPDLIFSKIYLSDNNVIPTLRRYCPSCPVVLISEYERSHTNPTGIRIIDYLLEPVTDEDVRRALKKFESQKSLNAVTTL